MHLNRQSILRAGVAFRFGPYVLVFRKIALNVYNSSIMTLKKERLQFMKSCLAAFMYLAGRVCVGGRTYMDLFRRKFKLLLTVQQPWITVSTCKNLTCRLVLCGKTRANSKMYSSGFNNSEHIVAREVCFWKCTL